MTFNIAMYISSTYNFIIFLIFICNIQFLFHWASFLEMLALMPFTNKTINAIPIYLGTYMLSLNQALLIISSSS